MLLLSFALCLLFFVIVGVLSVLKHKQSSTDYLLASHSVKPWLAALSAVATNNSGYMFLGQIGFTFMYGLQSAWLLIGWILGDLVTSTFVHKRLRVQTTDSQKLSYASVLSTSYFIRLGL